MNIGLGDILSTQGNFPVRAEAESGKVVVFREGFVRGRDIKRVTPEQQAKVSRSNEQVKHAVAKHLAESGMGHKDQRKVERDFTGFLQYHNREGFITSEDVKAFVKWEGQALTKEVFNRPDVPSSFREQAQRIGVPLLQDFFLGDQLPDTYTQNLKTVTKEGILDRCDTELEQMHQELDKAIEYFDGINENLKREGIDVDLLAAVNVSDPEEFKNLVKEQLKAINKNIGSNLKELFDLDSQEEKCQPLKRRKKLNSATGGLLFRGSAKRYKEVKASFHDRREKLRKVGGALTAELTKLSHLSEISGGKDLKDILRFGKNKEIFLQRFDAISDLRESLASDKGDSIIGAVRNAWDSTLGANIYGRLERTIEGNFEAWQGIQEKSQTLGIEVGTSKQIFNVLGITKNNNNTVSEILTQIQEISEQDVDTSAIAAEKKEQYVAFIKQLREFVLGAFAPIEDTGPVERMRRQDLNLEGQTQQTVRENQDLNLEGQMQDIVGEKLDEWKGIQEKWAALGQQVETPRKFLKVLGVNNKNTVLEILQRIEDVIGRQVDISAIKDSRRDQYVPLLKQSMEFARDTFTKLLV